MVEVQDTLVEKLSAIECENGNVEVQWNSVKKCVLGISWKENHGFKKLALRIVQGI